MVTLRLRACRGKGRWQVLQVPVRVVDAEAGTIAFIDEDGGPVQQSALSGKSPAPSWSGSVQLPAE